MHFGDIDNPEVAAVFAQYPEAIRKKLLTLRQLILNTASEMEPPDSLEETLKWGEPAYLCKTGSTIRMGWKSATPDQYYLYFHCKTKLIETFKSLYFDEFRFESNRAIVFHSTDQPDLAALKHCIALALNYHRIKHLPMLGV